MSWSLIEVKGKILPVRLTKFCSPVLMLQALERGKFPSQPLTPSLSCSDSSPVQTILTR